MKADKMSVVFRLLLRVAGNHSKIPDRMATTKATAARIDLGTAGADAIGAVDIVRIVKIVRISVADNISRRAQRLSRFRMIAVPVTSRDNRNN